MAKKDREFWQSAARNNATFLQYYNRLTELAISMFDWKNLPDTVDARFLELTLFTNGGCLFFKDDDLGGYACLPYTNNGRLNIYRIPIKRRAYSVTRYNKDYDEKNSVIIFNNMLHLNSMLDVRMYSERLYNLDRIIDVNANAQKTPVLIECSETERLTMLNLYKEFDGNAPVIYADKGLNAKGLTVLRTDAPYIADKIFELKTRIWNEALTYLGISNVSYQKKERMISDEVMRNMGGTIASRYSRLNSRREAADQINKMFGLEIEVDFREDYREMDDEVVFAGETGDQKMDISAIDLRTN